MDKEKLKEYIPFALVVAVYIVIACLVGDYCVNTLYCMTLDTYACCAAIAALILLPASFLLYFIISNITDTVIRNRKFNKRFNWMLKHKDDLPLSEEEKEYLIEENRKFIGIDEDYYKELKRYYKHNKSCKKSQ